MPISARWFLAGILVISMAAPSAAQTLYGSLVGNVTDSSGAALPGAKVLAVNTATGQTREAATDERGAWTHRFSASPRLGGSLQRYKEPQRRRDAEDVLRGEW